MARRRKTSLFDDLLSYATLLSWQGSLLIGLMSWYLLHGYGTQLIDLHRSDMPRALFCTLETGFQYFMKSIVALEACFYLRGQGVITIFALLALERVWLDSLVA